jgi:hypothetical protein
LGGLNRTDNKGQENKLMNEEENIENPEDENLNEKNKKIGKMVKILKKN